MHVWYRGLHARSQPGFPPQHSSTSAVCSHSWELGLGVQRKRTRLPKPAFTAVASPLLPLHKSIWHLVSNCFSQLLAGSCQSLKPWLGVVNFSAMVPWDSWAIFLTATMPAPSLGGKEGWSSPRVYFLRM